MKKVGLVRAENRFPVTAPPMRRETKEIIEAKKKGTAPGIDRINVEHPHQQEFTR